MTGLEPPGSSVIGRAAELDALERLIERTRHGTAGAVIVGEPGIGKTTVWEAGVVLARERGVRTLLPGIFSNAGWPTRSFTPLNIHHHTAHGFAVTPQGRATGLAAAIACWWEDKTSSRPSASSTRRPHPGPS